MKTKSTEESITIVYQPQAVFKVRAVTRCSSTLSGRNRCISLLMVGLVAEKIF